MVKLLVIGDDLHQPVPDIIAHIVAGNADQLQNHVHIPAGVGCVLLGQNGNLENLW